MSTVEKAWTRIWNALARGSISAVNDTGAVALAQVRFNYMEINDDVPLWQQFGLSSVPPVGSHAAVLFIGGDRSNGVIVATGNEAARPGAKAAGETVLHNAFGMTIYLSSAGIVINSGGLPVTLNGDLRVTGTITEGYGGADQVGVSTHHHTAPSGGGNTSAPVPGT